MKTREREIKLTEYVIDIERSDDGWHPECREVKYKYTFYLDEFVSLEDAKFIIKEEIPETIKEFIKENNTTKKQVLEFLNKNYK